MENTKTLYIDSTHLSTDLCTSGGYFNTDKSPWALNSVCCQHRKGYTAVYAFLFAPLKDKRINFAELGIEQGSSIFMWRNYFPLANIHAFELDEQKIANVKALCSSTLPSVFFHNIDVSNDDGFNRGMESAACTFDVIVDDTSHEIAHQNTIIKNASKYVKPGGMLIIEDIDRVTPISAFVVDEKIWSFYTFVTCHHDNRNCSDNDKILYLVRRDDNVQTS